MWGKLQTDEVRLLRLISPNLAKRITTAVATSKYSGFSAASAAKPKPAFSFRYGKGIKTHSYRNHTRPYTARITRGKRHVEGLRQPKTMAVVISQLTTAQTSSSHTQVRTLSTLNIENTWWGVKRSMPRTGTSKDLFESYLQEWLWRQHYGDDLFGNIIKYIADLYEVRAKIRKLLLVPLYALSVI